tara:strand:+ start:33 stop:224 length:192 start_codon:yes stop_codon:yes gene_type:complete
MKKGDSSNLDELWIDCPASDLQSLNFYVRPYWAVSIDREGCLDIPVMAGKMLGGDPETMASAA